MDPGQDLTDTKAAAIKNLIARAVKGMNFTNVSVFDAATMMEVGGEDEAGNTAGTGKDVAELTSQVEKSIAGNVRRVLELMYGLERLRKRYPDQYLYIILDNAAYQHCRKVRDKAEK